MVRKLAVFLVVCLLACSCGFADGVDAAGEIPQEAQDFVARIGAAMMDEWSADMGEYEVQAFLPQEEDGYAAYVEYIGKDYQITAGDRSAFDALYAVKIENGGVITVAYWNGSPAAYFLDGYTMDYVAGNLYLYLLLGFDVVLRELYPETGYDIGYDTFEESLENFNELGLGSAVNDYGDLAVVVFTLDYSSWMLTYPSVSIQAYTAEWCEHLEVTPEQLHDEVEYSILLYMQMYLGMLADLL